MVGKKGIFFTLIAVSMVVLAVLIQAPKPQEKTFEELRVVQMNRFFNDIRHSYLESALNTASYRALASLILYMDKKDALIDNFDMVFSDVVSTGNITEGGSFVKIDSVVEEKIMEGTSFNDWIEKLEAIAKSAFKVNLSIGLIGIGITQNEPWSVIVESNVSINLTGRVANWTNVRANVVTNLDIGGFADPLYVVMFNGLYNNKIKNTTVKDKWDSVKFNEHVGRGEYVHWISSDAPSFLMRFTNPRQASECCGIESILDGGKLTAIGMAGEISSVDYQYYRNVACPSVGLFEVDAVDISKKPIYLVSSRVISYGLTANEISEACPPQQ